MRIFIVKSILVMLLLLFFYNYNFSSTENPHGDIKWNCENCHTAEGWKKLKDPLEFSHKETGFPLSGSHKVANCVGCHSNLKFSNIGIECADCHTDVHRAQFGMECSNCHTPVDWEDRQDILTTHAERGFPLVGVHIIADCDACHISQGREEFVGTPVECEGCHIDNYNETVDPDHSLADFDLDCRECHSMVSSSWSPAEFEHTAIFSLLGAHSLINCSSCHAETYAGTPQHCIECHENDYSSTTSPSHNTLGFPTDCDVCHNETTWEGAEFDHLQVSGYELAGAHAAQGCMDCHINNQFDLARDCIGCHQNDYNSVADPNHTNANFPEDCTQCHNQTAWSPAQFDHNLTGFQLTGAHVTLDCGNCHINGQFSGTPSDCWSCHEENYSGVEDPDHSGNNFSQDCTLCHSTNVWSPTTFNHSQTQFPLTGAHVSLDCNECHSGGFEGTPADCWSCHEDDYIGAGDPDHVSNNFSQDCTECHTTDGWGDGVFVHSQTQFPLTGAHTVLNCIDCHAGGYMGTPIDCFACHESNYNNSTDPDHQLAGFPTTCEQCHTTDGWEPAQFDHGQTQFPLTGLHTLLNCIDCHAGGYAGTPTDCWSCHEDDYIGVPDPDHPGNNFSQDCTVCHSTQGWIPTTFDHGQTQFPLTGLHTLLNCVDCHAGGYAGTPTDCWSCHEDDYIGVPDPDHPGNNFSQDCTVCHATAGWIPTTFNHNTTNFPLTGTHTTLACIACHSTGYNNTPTACFACHEDDYNNALDPNHVIAGFPTTCEQCHNTTVWDQTTWDHDNLYFPIYSGRHQGEWNLCAECHVNVNNYVEFECIFCHEHNQIDMLDAHESVPGYVWQSTACYNCHPNGEVPP